MEGEFFEQDDRLLLIRDKGRQGWALGYDKQWRPVAETFSGQVYFEGTKLSTADAQKRYGVDLTKLPA